MSVCQSIDKIATIDWLESNELLLKHSTNSRTAILPESEDIEIDRNKITLTSYDMRYDMNSFRLECCWRQKPFGGMGIWGGGWVGVGVCVRFRGFGNWVYLLYFTTLITDKHIFVNYQVSWFHLSEGEQCWNWQKSW